MSLRLKKKNPNGKLPSRCSYDSVVMQEAVLTAVTKGRSNSKLMQLLGDEFVATGGNSKAARLLGEDCLPETSSSCSSRSSIRSFSGSEASYNESEESWTEEMEEESSATESPKKMVNSYSVQQRFVSSRKQIDVLLELMDLQDQMVNV
eukprot:TRINITY_DN511_c0_g1_i1.p1 TRINITY_DN511_c0_g1~~TRINITY_DN511_c0_g1_i1.p1  ORF type:complete len:149 (-),score=38.58 TRINITY_DN511_c0_g1_i1:216-662(-)